MYQRPSYTAMPRASPCPVMVTAASMRTSLGSRSPSYGLWGARFGSVGSAERPSRSPIPGALWSAAGRPPGRVCAPRRRSGDRHYGRGESGGRGPDVGGGQVMPASRTVVARTWPICEPSWGVVRVEGGVPQGAAASATARSEVASCSASTRAMGRSIAEWYGASPSSTAGRSDAATPTLPSGTSMASKC